MDVPSGATGYSIAAAAAAVAVGSYIYAKSGTKGPDGTRPLSSAPRKAGGHPVLGIMPDLTSSDVHRRLTAWANELGPFYTISIMGSTVVVLSDPALARPLVNRGPDELPKYAVAYSPANQLGTAQKQPGLFTCTHETAYHQAIRKAVAPAFSSSNIAKKFPTTRDTALKLVEVLASAAGPQELDITNFVTAASFDMVAQNGYDIQFHALDDPVNNLFLNALKGGLREISARITDPLRETLQTVFWWLPSSRKVQRDFEGAYSVFSHIMKELRSRGEPSPEDQSIGACLMRLRHPDGNRPLTEPELQANVSAFLVGGFDTTTAAVLWALYDIARQADVQRGLEKELTDAGLITTEGRPGRLPEWSDLTSLPYFNAVMKESMRLHNVAGCTTTFRVTEKPMQIGEYWVPKGTPIWIPAHTMANSRHNFPSPDDFHPERWMSDAAPNVQAMGREGGSSGKTEGGWSTQLDWTSLTFSSGTRSCPGTTQGLAQVRTLMLVLLSRLRFALGPTLSDHQAVEAGQVMALVVASSVGHPFIITRR